MLKKDIVSIVEKPSGKSKGGFSRAQSLTPEKRKDIARKAALARWDGDLPMAQYEGSFLIGDVEVSCAVLPNGQRIITQAAFLRSLGRSPSPKAGEGVLSTHGGLPVFLRSEVFEGLIDEELRMSTTPVFYRTKTGGRGVGYDARLLPKVAEVYLKYRDKIAIEEKESNRKIPNQYKLMVISADILIRGLADVGILALVDEATGYQKDRAKDALARILEAFVVKELQVWVKTFPDEFYSELFRLRGLSFPKDTVKKPQYFGILTNDIVYERLAPGVLEELKRLTPKTESGRLKHQLTRRLTKDHGHPKLREYLASVVTIMKLSKKYFDFKEKLDLIHPKYGHPIPLNFEEANVSDEGL
jgi:P63C domain